VIRFLDGPAAGQVLELRRVPLLLRVVRNRMKNTWDALDQLDDTPKEREEIFVYLRSGQVQKIHIKADCRGGGSRWVWIADYVHLIDQPTDAQLRETEAWRAWAAEYAAPWEVS
jgi:hypothetical protein